MPALRGLTLAAAFLALGGCAAQYGRQSDGAAAAPPRCQAVSEPEIAALFDRWNASLQTGDPQKVGANYAPRSILLATLSNQPRVTAQERAEYFHHFLENRPSGTVTQRHIDIGCNMAVDSGLYTFRFAKTGAVAQARYTYAYRWDGAQWLIISHHSSLMPERQ
ncbi:MAG: DUF4440 domain-containing protein [Comamonas sp.]